VGEVGSGGEQAKLARGAIHAKQKATRVIDTVGMEAALPGLRWTSSE